MSNKLKTDSVLRLSTQLSTQNKSRSYAVKAKSISEQPTFSQLPR